MKSTRGAIAAGHPDTAQAGAEILEEGGNAFDAVVASALTSFVTEMTLTNAGGGGFLTAYSRDTGKPVVLDFFVNMPGLGGSAECDKKNFFPVLVDFGTTHQEFHVGAASIAVPGSIAGLFEIHRRYGTLPMTRVAQPAIRLAREGVTINQHQAYFFSILEPILTMTEEGKKIVCPNKTLLSEGGRLFNKDFADTLEALVKEGPSLFYTGALAYDAVRVVQDAGGMLTLKDLDNYCVEERAPLALDYKGYTLLTNPPPSAGGSLIALSLKMLENLEWTQDDYLTSNHIEGLIAVMQLTNRIRSFGYDQWLHKNVEKIYDLFRTEHIDSYRSHFRQILTGQADHSALPNENPGSGNTTQISVMDEMGNAASLTASNGEGSGIMIPGTGIHLNNMLGEEDLNPNGFHDHTPGHRVSSMMSPSILLKGREPIAVLGSGGSNRIRSAILQTAINLIDFKMSIKDAVDSPRIHWERDRLDIESGIDAIISEHLSDPSDRNYWKETNLFFGGVHAVTYNPESGIFSGAGDYRRGGISITV